MAIQRHVRINRVPPNNYADTTTRDDTRGGESPGRFPWCTIINETPISILADVSELMPPAPPWRIFQNGYTGRLSCLSCPFSPILLVRSHCAPRSFTSFASPGRERNDARVGPDDKCCAIMQQVVSKVSAVTSGCYMHAGYHRRGIASLSLFTGQ